MALTDGRALVPDAGRRPLGLAAQTGFVVSAELLLIAVLLILGALVGLEAIRTAVVTELADVGGSIGSVSQTYSYSGVAGHHASANGAIWEDAGDACELIQSVVGGQGGVNSRCVAICEIAGGLSDPSPESGPPLPYNPFP